MDDARGRDRGLRPGGLGAPVPRVTATRVAQGPKAEPGSGRLRGSAGAESRPLTAPYERLSATTSFAWFWCACCASWKASLTESRFFSAAMAPGRELREGDWLQPAGTQFRSAPRTPAGERPGPPELSNDSRGRTRSRGIFARGGTRKPRERERETRPVSLLARMRRGCGRLVSPGGKGVCGKSRGGGRDRKWCGGGGRERAFNFLASGVPLAGRGARKGRRPAESMVSAPATCLTEESERRRRLRVTEGRLETPQPPGSASQSCGTTLRSRGERRACQRAWGPG